MFQTLEAMLGAASLDPLYTIVAAFRAASQVSQGNTDFKPRLTLPLPLRAIATKHPRFFVEIGAVGRVKSLLCCLAKSNNLSVL